MRDMMSMFYIGTVTSKEEIEETLKETCLATVSKEHFEEILNNIWMDVQDAQKQN